MSNSSFEDTSEIDTTLAAERIRVIAKWREFLADPERREALLATAGQPEETPDGVVREVPVPSDLEGDFAVVDMNSVEIDTPHFHIEGEIEVHFPLWGRALMSVGEGTVVLQPGDHQIIDPGTPHFIVPDEGGYGVGVLSLPGYDPANQIPVDLAAPQDNFNAALYLAYQNVG